MSLVSSADAKDETVVKIKILGDLEIAQGELAVSELPPALARTLVLIAASGRNGIAERELTNLLPSRAIGERLTTGALQRRIADLRHKFRIPIPELRGGAKRYALDFNKVVSVDALEFVAAVQALPDDAGVSVLDGLLGMWRGNPWTTHDERLSSPWRLVANAREELLARVGKLSTDERAELTHLTRFCELFPEDPAVHRLGAAVRRARHRLLVVEDQIMDDLRAVLDSEFDVVPVTSLKEWNQVRNSLDVSGALIDRHLGPDMDSLGTTVIAEYLRRHTDIPAALMSVAPPPTFGHQRDLRLKYRLLEVVLKRSNGKLNEAAIIEAARALVDTTDAAWCARQELLVESDAYHVEADTMFSRDRRAGERARQCRKEADQLLIKLRRAPAAEMEPEVRDFHRRWGDRSRAATS